MSVDEATIEALKKAVEGIKDTSTGTEETSSFAAALSAAVAEAAPNTATDQPAPLPVASAIDSQPHDTSDAGGEIDSALFSQLTAALSEQPPRDSQQPSASTADSLGLDVDRQLLLDSIKSIVSGDNDTNKQNSVPHQTTLSQDEQAMQEALLMATRQLGATGQPASYQYDAYRQGGFQLEGEADAATLQVVQSVLQDLGGHWGDADGGKARRRRHASPMTEEDRERIRIDNRNRKKRWRDTNLDRNRDNDLRGRIVRRAAAIFGPMDSKQKLDWIEEEYLRRRERRMIRDGSARLRGHGIAGLSNQHRSLASEHLSALFRESNAILSPSMLVTAGYVPNHLISGPMVPCPARPAYSRRYKRSPRENRASSRDTMGAPPVLEDLIVKLE